MDESWFYVERNNFKYFPYSLLSHGFSVNIVSGTKVTKAQNDSGEKQRRPGEDDSAQDEESRARRRLGVDGLFRSQFS